MQKLPDYNMLRMYVFKSNYWRVRLIEGEGAARRKKRMRVMERYIKEGGIEGRSLLQCLRYGVGAFGFTRKTAGNLIRDMEFCGTIKVKGLRVILRPQRSKTYWDHDMQP